MDYDSFKATLGDAAPPEGAGPALQALWWQAPGRKRGGDDWKTAHKLAQRDNGAAGAWVHAHLHRVEGDEGNAGYWYRRAEKPHAKEPLEAEWAAIAKALCEG